MPTIKGNNKDNRLVGYSDVFGVTNYMYGYAGNDTLEGGFQADNYIWGGTGDDVIDGGTGLNRLYGEDGNDVIRVFWSDTDSELYGGAGDDQLIAGGGGAYLDGGTGADLMIGGDGGDVFIVDNAGDIVQDTWVPKFDNQPNPTDTVRASVSYALGANALIEVLETTNATAKTAINLTGNAASQTIIGNAGKNVLDGKGGNDVLIGGAGADTLIGGAGKDTASYATASSGVTANLANSSSNTGDAKGDKYNSIENLIGSNFNDRLSGDSGSNKITGGKGNDSIMGSAGKDTLKGEAGNDIVNGGADSDTLSGGRGKDTFVFDTALGANNVDKITDFNVIDDVIHLENAIFKKLTTTGVLSEKHFVANASGTAADKNDRIIYETDTGYLFYDADGTGAAQAIHFATLTPGLALTEEDFFVI